MSARLHHHHPAAHPRSRPTSAKTPSLTHRPAPPASPMRSFPSVPRQQWVLNRGKQTAAPPSSKRETDESGAFSSRKTHSARISLPREYRVCAPSPNKRRKDHVCHQVSNNKGHGCTHLLNALLVLAIVTVKNRFYLFHSRFDASNKPVIEDEEEDDVFSRRPFILWSRR